MLKAAVHHKFDMIAAWSVDRLGRSLKDLVAFLGELKGTGVDLSYTSRRSTHRLHPVAPCFRCWAFSLSLKGDDPRENPCRLARARAQGKRLGWPPIASGYVYRCPALARSRRQYSQHCEG
jgi:DNA invertase Pin-like site-specific DNA recombinase